MRESDALFVIGVSWAIVLLAWLVVTIVVRRVPAPTSAERERLEAFFDPMVAWGGAMVWGLAALGASLVIWRQATGAPLPKNTVWLIAASWAGLFLPSWSAMWLVRWWVHRGGHADTPPSTKTMAGDGISAAGQWLVRFLSLAPAAAFVGFVAAVGPLHALRVLGFGIGVGCLGVVAAVATVRLRGRATLAARFASWAMLGITALSYLFTRDLEGSIPKFSSAGASIATTTAFLVLLYLMVGAMTVLAVLPVVTGARSRQPAYRQLYLIHIRVLIYSAFYILPALIATELVTAAQRPVSFETFWESHFFHTSWLLGWQVASWLLVLLRVRGAMSRPPLAGLDERDGRPLALPLAPFLAALLVLGTVTETWRGLWWVWGGTAAVFVLVALDLHRMWRGFRP